MVSFWEFVLNVEYVIVLIIRVVHASYAVVMSHWLPQDDRKTHKAAYYGTNLFPEIFQLRSRGYVVVGIVIRKFNRIFKIALTLEIKKVMIGLTYSGFGFILC